MGADPTTDGDGSGQPAGPSPRPRRSAVRRVLRWTGVALLAFILLTLGLALVPVDVSALEESHGEPATNRGEAVELFEAWAAPEDEENVFEPCRSALYDTGARTQVAVVLFHGLTNCPRQFREIAESLRTEGMNVVVLRAPKHGIADESGTGIGPVSEASSFSAEDMVRWADASVDVAAGLGDSVRVMGISMGGLVAAWTAQNREVERVVAVAPAVGLRVLPGPLGWAAPNLVSRLPDFSVSATGDLDHAYGGETISGAAEMMLLSRAILAESDREPPQTVDVTVVTNAADTEVANARTEVLVRQWREQGAHVIARAFPARLGLPHDVVDVANPSQQTSVTYPVLLGLLNAGG
ncbi:carboxylesterase [Mumia flava]|uniref:Carboxylesterase n=1 Tax=Mumia flava TaxID=1348852 RepID=A0A0B2B2R0_9ACTN|nr:alpha/beta fold hydrolase [Mumia flava]PJJ56116.1 carboxylesterase [Mumia flava]